MSTYRFRVAVPAGIYVDVECTLKRRSPEDEGVTRRVKQMAVAKIQREAVTFDYEGIEIVGAEGNIVVFPDENPPTTQITINDYEKVQ